MSLLHDINILIPKITKVQDVVDQGNTAEVLRQRQEELEEATKKLELAVSLMQTSNEYLGIPIGLHIKGISNATKKFLTELTEEFAKDRNALAGNPKVKQQWNAIDKITKTVTNQYEAAWAQYATKYRVAIDETKRNLAYGFSLYKELADSINELEMQLDSLIKLAPRASTIETIIQSLKSTSTQLAEKAKELSELDFSQEFTEVILAINEGNMTLAHLTSELWKQLEDNNLLSRVALRLKKD